MFEDIGILGQVQYEIVGTDGLLKSYGQQKNTIQANLKERTAAAYNSGSFPPFMGVVFIGTAASFKSYQAWDNDANSGNEYSGTASYTASSSVVVGTLETGSAYFEGVFDNLYSRVMITPQRLDNGDTLTVYWAFTVG